MFARRFMTLSEQHIPRAQAACRAADVAYSGKRRAGYSNLEANKVALLALQAACPLPIARRLKLAKAICYAGVEAPRRILARSVEHRAR